MPLAAWRENSSRHVASLRRIRLVFFIAPVSSTITGRDYPQWTDLRKYVAELPVTADQPFATSDSNQNLLIACFMGIAVLGAVLRPRLPAFLLPHSGQLLAARGPITHRLLARRASF